MFEHEDIKLGTHIDDIAGSCGANGGKLNAAWLKNPNSLCSIILYHYGIRGTFSHFLVANQHPGLDDIFDGTAWEGGLWRLSLEKLNWASKHNPRQFPGSCISSQRCTLVPIDYALIFAQFGELYDHSECSEYLRRTKQRMYSSTTSPVPTEPE
jgi:hypothetical protein